MDIRRKRASISDERTSRLRLETLTTLRWAAILGQIGSVGAALFWLELDLNYIWLSLVISASFLFNAYFWLFFPPNTQLHDREAAAIVAFDVTQLVALLYLAGGLNNPFALLVLAPVSVAATAFSPRHSILIGLVAIVEISFVALFHMPLAFSAGPAISMPPVILTGHWAAIVIGVSFAGIYSWRVSSEIDAVTEALRATQLALAREQELTDIGGVVAAAAHELGTPLATIKLASAELVEELQHDEALKSDAALIHEQASVCGDILRSMGKTGHDDKQVKITPLQNIIEEAADPHLARGKTVLFELLEGAAINTQPFVDRRPELIHGIRNFIQNAVDFSTSTVWVETWWDENRVGFHIIDDGPGFPTDLLGRLGDPIFRKRGPLARDPLRPEYEGMGLGLFIAKTLLERLGANIAFENALDSPLRKQRSEQSGAVVRITFERARICVGAQEARQALGANKKRDVT